MKLDSTQSVGGIDWGTTHRRAYALDANGTCTHEFIDSDGALACKGRFATALDFALQQLPSTPDVVILSGMVGSALGWHNVAYVDAHTALPDLVQRLYRVADAHGSAPCYIVPGYCIRNAHGQPDVMRGEETQLLGAWALGHTSGWFVLPGTHSKWVELRDGVIVQLRTYMTGELFHLLSHQGTLAAAAGDANAPWDADAFASGVRAAGQGALSHQLFSCRARVVCADMPAAAARAYLSGVLIGAEMHDVMQGQPASALQQALQLIGSPELCALYQTAAGLLALPTELLDAKAVFIAALRYFQTHWKPT